MSDYPDDEVRDIRYDALPTCRKFHESEAFVRGLAGPIGSGKSVAMCLEIIARAFAQKPGPDGVRRSRVAIIRNTSPQLTSTTIKTWIDWVNPKYFGRVKYSSPITHDVKLAHDCDLEVLFLAMDRPEDERKVLSLELSGVWINEAREIPYKIVQACLGRVGRYPGPKDGRCTRKYVIMDTNPPDDDHWWYRLAEEETPSTFEFFRQPGGMAIDAENIENLPDRYYQDLAESNPAEWVNVYVHGNYGNVQDGKPIYPEFSDSVHVSQEPLVAYRQTPLVVGIDLGLTPAATICQQSPRGQFRILDELVSEDMGILQFSKTMLKPILRSKYAGLSARLVIDPAGSQRAQTDEKTCRDILREEGFNVRLARTNNFAARREAVAGFLTRMIDGEPAFLMSPTCKMLRKGMAGAYKFRRVQVAGDERYHDKPDKNRFSHVSESAQYSALEIQGVTGHVKRRIPRAATYQPASSAGY